MVSNKMVNYVLSPMHLLDIRVSPLMITCFKAQMWWRHCLDYSAYGFFYPGFTPKLFIEKTSVSSRLTVLMLWHCGPSLENLFIGPIRHHPKGVRLVSDTFLSNESRLFSYTSWTSGLSLPIRIDTRSDLVSGSLNLARCGQHCCRSFRSMFRLLNSSIGTA